MSARTIENRNAMLRLVGVLVVVGLLLASVFSLRSCAGDDTAADSSDAGQGAAVEDTATAGGEEQTATDEGDEDMFHDSDVEVTGDEIAVVTTAKGVIKFGFFAEDAPNTVASFIELADSGFYDGTTFHRVEDFVVQGGDPFSKTGEGIVGTGGPGYKLKAEFNARPHVDGTIAMAHTQDHPDSAGSQFYITKGPRPYLDGQYTVFGQVTEGLDVVYATEAGDVIESLRIERPQ